MKTQRLNRDDKSYGKRNTKSQEHITSTATQAQKTHFSLPLHRLHLWHTANLATFYHRHSDSQQQHTTVLNATATTATSTYYSRSEREPYCTRTVPQSPPE